ncbi:putative transmembrane protein [Rhizoctonia solani 123E]|uniref:Putative transmembrane protein n=1 Tax=Rhizoctonia solani 123E TaxID=1423351 RepID=A0A074SD83_9AGAM|nr:putative transmembrane protein [Rhizoctonia solani 123E]
MLIANGSQPSSTPLASNAEAPVFQASAKDICVNVLWFLSLSLSVAVSLISMLAKEWCLEFMAGRTGPPGSQARRRQQRWDGLVKWRMKEVIVLLPSLIHVSLLLFAIGLCVFLWDVHYGVAIPVVIVTTTAAGAYFACTVVPLLYHFCPYGTVLSRAIKQFTSSHSRLTQDEVQDDVIGNALHWMIANCETPRSVDVALQSLAAADEKVSATKLEEVNAWSIIKQRVESSGVSEQSEQSRAASRLYKRALEAIPATRRRTDGLSYGGRDVTRKLEQLVLGVQSTINGLIHEVLADTRSLDPSTTSILKRCTLIGSHYLSKIRHPQHEGKLHQVNPIALVEEIVNLLEPYLTTREVNLNDQSALCRALLANFAFVLCCNVAREPMVNPLCVGYILRLVRGRGNTSRFYSHDQPNMDYFVLATLCLSISSDYSDKSNSPPATPYASIEEAFETLWAGLMQTIYSDSSALKSHATCLTHGILYLLANPNHYNLTNYESGAISTILRITVNSAGLLSKIDINYHTRYIKDIHRNLEDANGFKYAPQFLTALYKLWSSSPLDGHHRLTSEMYILVVKCLCLADDNDMNGWDRYLAYEMLRDSPFPRCSPQLIRHLSSTNLIAHLSNLTNHNDANKQMFATAQLWLWLNMSLSETDRTNPTLNSLEEALLQYPDLDNKLEKQEEVAEKLEIKLLILLEELRDELNEYGTNFGSTLRGYICRVIEIMLQKRSAPLPAKVSDGLEDISEDLRGVESFENLDTNEVVTDPGIVFVPMISRHYYYLIIFY